MEILSNKAARAAALFLVLLSMVVLIAAGRRESVSDSAADGQRVDPVITSTNVPAPEGWDVFDSSSVRTDSTNVNVRFRLAGTFFLMPSEEEGGDERRLAIIDDDETSRQHIVSEGDLLLDSHEVLRIYPDRVVLSHDGRELVLELSFKPVDKGQGGDDAGAASVDSGDGQDVVLESNRFGKRVGENRWVMSKEELVRYYEELLEEPERIAALYMSLKPLYDDEQDITGYHLEQEGEAEFFKAVGLREGDRIRKVNSMPMVSQRRAEYFIHEFMQDRLGAAVLDIERDGKPVKLIYLLR